MRRRILHNEIRKILQNVQIKIKSVRFFLLYRKLRSIKQKTLREDAHEFVWKMYCVPNSARQSVQAHWESVMSRSVLARFVPL